MKRCKACGREYRKGTLAFILTADGFMGARVCPQCARRGVVIVAPKVAPVLKVAPVVKTTAADEGVARTLRQLRVYARAARAAAAQRKGSEADFQSGRTEGFLGAIELLKRECGGSS